MAKELLDEDGRILIIKAGSSAALSFAITDLSDTLVTPNTFLWTLSELDGTDINSRSDVSETPAATNYVLLEGADLVNPGVLGNLLDKLIRIKGTYDTLVGGDPETNVPYVEEYTFKVEAVIND